MAWQRGIGGSGSSGEDRVSGASGGMHELRRVDRSAPMATGTLACPSCDAPVAPLPRAMSPADPLGCPYCGHAGAVREFLSLTLPTRPARVVIRVVDRRGPALRITRR